MTHESYAKTLLAKHDGIRLLEKGRPSKRLHLRKFAQPIVDQRNHLQTSPKHSVKQWEQGFFRPAPTVLCDSFAVSADFKSKVGYGIVIGNILNHFAQCLHVARVLSIFHPSSDQVAQDASEIFMPCIG